MIKFLWGRSSGGFLLCLDIFGTQIYNKLWNSKRKEVKLWKFQREDDRQMQSKSMI